MTGFRAALSFLTPFGGATAPTPRALPWFGVVGALVGAGVGAAWWGAAQWLPALAAAVIAVTADAALTGLLHLDGLADSADGLLPPLTPERRLAVMRDPHAGVFGVATLVLALLLRTAVLASITPAPATILVVAALWSAARTAMAVIAGVVPYARPAGLAAAFVDRAAWPRALAVGAPLALVLGALGADPPARGVLAVVAAGLAAAAVAGFARARIGGFTGDVLGAAGVVAESTGLVLLVVHA